MVQYPIGTYLLEVHSTLGPRCVLKVEKQSGVFVALDPVQAARVVAVCGDAIYCVGAATHVSNYYPDTMYRYTVLTEEEAVAYMLST